MNGKLGAAAILLTAKSSSLPAYHHFPTHKNLRHRLTIPLLSSPPHVHTLAEIASDPDAASPARDGQEKNGVLWTAREHMINFISDAFASRWNRTSRRSSANWISKTKSPCTRHLSHLAVSVEP